MPRTPAALPNPSPTRFSLRFPITDTMKNDALLQRANATTKSLLAYCEGSDWAGHDPYDALNSRLLQAMPFLQSRVPQIVLTQVLKRSPDQRTRPGAGAEDTESEGARPFSDGIDQAVGCRWHRSERGDRGHRRPARGASVARDGLLVLGLQLSVADARAARAAPQPEPRMHDIRRQRTARRVRAQWRPPAARDGGERGALHRERSVLDRRRVGRRPALSAADEESRVHNANLLGAALLCRVHRYTGDKKMLSTALAVTRYSASKQRADGSWPYGEMATQAWIDNFHTGYNLSGLRAVERVRRHIRVRRAHPPRVRVLSGAFLPGGRRAALFSRPNLPDRRALRGAEPDHAARIQAPRTRGASRRRRRCSTGRWRTCGTSAASSTIACCAFGTIRTSYMRWSQAWMFLALSTLLNELSGAAASRQASPLLDAVHG